MQLPWRSSIVFEPLVVPWVFGLCLLALTLTAFLLWKASGTLASRRRRILFGFRLVVLLGALVTLAGPTLRHERVRSIPGTVLLLVDRSASMDLATRQEALRRVLDLQQIKKLEKRFSLLRFAFSSGLEAWNDNSLAEAPTGDKTNILNSLEEAVAVVEGSPIAGIVLITDGVDSDAKLEAKARAKALKVPIFVLAPPSASSRDLALSASDESPLAFVRNTRLIKVKLSARGVSGMEVIVKIEAPGTAERLQRVKVQGDAAEIELEIPFKPMRVGRQVLRVSTPLVAQEEDETNNVLLLPMDVVRDRLRVLLVAGAPTWDVRFLRRLLKEDPGVDLVSFFILRTPEDSNQIPEEELSLIPFPERELFEEQLHTFDVVLFVDFNFAPYSVGRYLGRIRRFVEQDGGGFAMIGGMRSFFEGQYQGTDIARLLPVTITEQAADLRPFMPKVLAPNHPIMALGLDSGSEDVLAAMPLLHGRNRLGEAKPGASVIMVHPEHTEASPAPIMVAAPVGRGRALALAVDSLWRWQLSAAAKGQKARPYYRIWHNMLRWLSGDPAFSRLSWEELPSDLEKGRRLQFSLRLRGHDWKPLADANLRLTLKNPDHKHRKVEGTTDKEGRFAVDLDPLESGPWNLEASALLGGQELARSEAVIIAGQASAERRLVGPNATLIKELAQASGGVAYDWNERKLSDLPFDETQRGERIEAIRSEPLWNHPLWLLFFLIPGLLAIALRRRWQLA
jgi:uncharacterized membrane protein